MTLLMSGGLTIAISAIVFLLITLVLVIALLYAKTKLVPSGNIKVVVNGEKEFEAPIGGTVLGTLQAQGIYLSSACGGSGSCGQCRCQVEEGGGNILPTEVGFFSRKQIKDHWRLGCQTKVKEDMVIRVPEEVFGVKAKDLIGKSVLDLEYLPFEDRKNYQAEDLDTIQKSKTVVREQLTPLKNGKFYHTIYSVNGFKDTQGNPAGLIGVFVDITKQKETEEKLQNAMNKLEELHESVKSSIEYAGMIQSSLISSPEVLKKYFKQSYAVWQAKDTVGGDIYIFEELSKDECMLFLIDCTGHGVPGALGTVLVKTIERNIYKNIF